MTTYAVTGATGQLGRLVVTELLAAGIEPASIVAIARTPAKAADLADRGVDVRTGDYSEPETLPAALAGVDTLLLVSGSEVGLRLPQHTAVIEAAKAAGVGRIVYTSILRADTTEISLAPEHKATEELLISSGLPYTFLRNGWYIENYTRQLADHLQRGVILGAAGDGRVAAAARLDYATAAAAAMTGEGHENAVYELGGTPFTLTELAAAITEVTDTLVEYRNVSADELIAALTGSGLDEGTAAFVASLDIATARGDLDTDSTDLQRLIGRPLTPLAEVIRAAYTG